MSRGKQILTHRSNRAGHRRGAAIVYIVVVLVVLMGFVSLAVDLGHVQVVKTQLQTAAEAAARAGADALSGGTTAAQNAAVAAAAANTADGTAVSLTVSTDVIVGTWNSSTNAFTSGGSSPNAVKVTARRTTATGHPVSLTFGKMIGQSTCNVNATSIAAVIVTTVPVTFQATSNPYFAGMPNGTTNTWGDTIAANGATQVTGITVAPGAVLTFTTFTGTTSVVPGTVAYVGPNGLTTAPSNDIAHGIDYDGSGSSYTENGIADAIMPDSALTGLFLTNNAPNLTTASSTVVDWTQTSQNNQATYTNLQTQQPFLIGDGKTTGSSPVVQKFVVPSGATRFFIGIWDGEDYGNNDGSLSGSVTSTVTQTVQ